MDSATLDPSSTLSSPPSAIDRALRHLAVAAASEEDFYSAVAEALSVGLECRTTGIAILGRDGKTAAVRALWDQGQPGATYRFEIRDSPSVELYAPASEATSIEYGPEVVERFPDFSMLQQLGARGYVAEAFFGADLEPVGHLFAISDQARELSTEAHEFLQLVRDRVGAEYRRYRAAERRESYERVVADATDYVAVVNLGYGYESVNRAYLEAFSWEAGGLLPGTVAELHGARSFESSFRPILDRAFDGETVHTHGWFDMPTRKRQFLDVSVVPYRAGGGKVTGATLYLRNLTAQRVAQQERRGLEKRLEQARKIASLGLMAGGMAHEFNNLLVGVLGGADLLLTEELTEEGQRTARTIKQSALQASDLCRRMLAYTGQAANTPAPVDVTQHTRETIAAFAGALPEKVSVELDVLPELPTTEIDPDDFSHIVRCLISNAAEAYEGRAGTVEVSTGTTHIDHSFLDRIQVPGEVQPGDFVFLQVRDKGCGVDPDTRGRIFDPFFSTKPSHSGLGLAATLGMVHSHRGCVQFETQTGVGTTVRVFFPVPDEAVAPRPASNEEESAKGVVLLIESDPMVREIASTMLRHAGFCPLTASSAAEGETIFSARARQIDMVLLDVRLPGKPVGETVDRLLTLDPTARIVLCSTSSPKDPALQPVLAKSYGFLAKPFSSDVLVTKVEDTVSHRAG